MNQKNHFVSTYQKDYDWPYAPVICQTEPPTKPDGVKVCPCTDSRRILKELLDANLESLGEYLERKRMKKEPKIYTTTEPIFQTLHFNSSKPSNSCIKKEECCPDPLLKNLFERLCLDEKKARVAAERFKTTYQAHYSDPAAARTTERDLATQAIIHTNDQQVRCRMPIKITIETDDECPPDCHPSSSRVNARVKHVKRNEFKCKKKCDMTVETKLPPWRSEYQDSINKIGHAIMRAKLHHAKKKALPFQYQHCMSN